MLMRIITSAFIVLSLVIGSGSLASARQAPKYGVSVKVVTKAALEKARTYTGVSSQPSPVKDINAQIVAAVDRELAARGFTKAASGKGDVQATYASLSRTDVDLKSKPDASGTRQQYSVGVLGVELRDSASQKAVFRVRIDTPIESSTDA